MRMASRAGGEAIKCCVCAGYPCSGSSNLFFSEMRHVLGISAQAADAARQRR